MKVRPRAGLLCLLPKPLRLPLTQTGCFGPTQASCRGTPRIQAAEEAEKTRSCNGSSRHRAASKEQCVRGVSTVCWWVMCWGTGGLAPVRLPTLCCAARSLEVPGLSGICCSVCDCSLPPSRARLDPASRVKTECSSTLQRGGR